MSRLILYTLSILFLGACTHKKNDNPLPVTQLPCAVPDTISFQKDIIPIFNIHCSTPGCHSGTKPEKNFNLEASKAYTTLSKKGSGYIDVSDPKGSVLYSALVSVDTPMPPTGKLDSCTLKTIEIWMKQGGKNN